MAKQPRRVTAGTDLGRAKQVRLFPPRVGYVWPICDRVLLVLLYRSCRMQSANWSPSQLFWWRMGLLLLTMLTSCWTLHGVCTRTSAIVESLWTLGRLNVLPDTGTLMFQVRKPTPAVHETCVHDLRL